MTSKIRHFSGIEPATSRLVVTWVSLTALSGRRQRKEDDEVEGKNEGKEKEGERPPFDDET